MLPLMQDRWEHCCPQRECNAEGRQGVSLCSLSHTSVVLGVTAMICLLLSSNRMADFWFCEDSRGSDFIFSAASRSAAKPMILSSFLPTSCRHLKYAVSPSNDQTLKSAANNFSLHQMRGILYWQTCRGIFYAFLEAMQTVMHDEWC